MSILAIFICDYPECSKRSDPVLTDYIDTYSYHDAPGDGVTACEPAGWLHDILYRWIACPQHRAKMLSDRARYGRGTHAGQ